MARAPRIHVHGAFYHLILRGNHRQDIFRVAADRAIWERYVSDALLDCGARLHVYCWMTNHVHMVVEASSNPVGRLVMRVATRYARWFQRSIDTTGHLFERRYRAYIVATDDYLLTLARYIHRNPVRGGLAATVDDYPWSSHHEYLGRRASDWLATDFMLRMLGGSAGAAAGRSAYARLMEVEGEEPLLPAPQAPSVRAAGRPERAPQPGRVVESLDRLIERVAAEHGVTSAALGTGIRSSHLSQVRAEIARQAIVTGIATTADVARRFGCSTAAVSKAVARMRRAAR
jgi:REP element-mobilizing transposase RayT